MSLSQCSSLTAAGSGTSLLQELAGFLRRSLTHQAAVRETLYHVGTAPHQISLASRFPVWLYQPQISLAGSLYMVSVVNVQSHLVLLVKMQMSALSSKCGMQGILVVTQSDPIAQDAMLELLLPRLSQLFETDKAQPPLKLGTCVSEQVCC